MSKLQDELDGIVITALAMGWSQQGEQKNNVVLRAPAPFTAITVEVPRRASDAYRSHMLTSVLRKVVKYADPLKRVTFFQEAPPDIQLLARRAKIADLPRYDPPKPKATQLAEAYGASELAAAQAAAAEREEAAAPTPPPRRVVHEAPWMARKTANPAGGTRYTSHAVIQRTWSDGSTDYRCAQAGCAFHDDDPIRVARHYGRSVDHDHPGRSVHGEGKPVVRDPDYTEPSYRQLNRQKRVEALSSRLEKILREVKVEDNCHEIGWLATRIAERLTPERDNVNPVTGAPLSDAELVERIRRLLDRGEYLRLQDQVAEQATKLAELEQRVKEETEAKMRAVDRWNALAELIREDQVP